LPTVGRPVHLRGSPHRLQPGTSPHALRIPPHDGHPALRELRSGGSRSAWVCFRLSPACPFRPLHTFHSSRPARHYPRFWIRRSSSERRRDLNPPDQTRCSAHTMPLCDSRPPYTWRLSLIAFLHRPSPLRVRAATGSLGSRVPRGPPVSMRAWGLRLRRAAACSRLRPLPCCLPVGLTPSAPMSLAISELIYFRDTQPTYAPDANASSAPLRCALTCSGVRMVATPFLHDSFIHYFTPVYPDAIQATGLPIVVPGG
jgi:hypothetical protein